MQEYIENDDHHIVFDVTIDVCMRVPSRFFSQQACIVRSRSSLFVSYIFFLFNMQARKKEENWSYRFVYIIDWPLLIQGQHIMFLLGSYSFIHFFLR
jgi:hypothetical protein